MLSLKLLVIGLLSVILSIVSIELEKKITINEETSFSFSGSVVSGNPSLSWNSVSGATSYEIIRLPVPGLGGASERKCFTVSGTSVTDTEVSGAVLGTGFDQVRYQIKAIGSSGVIDSDGPVDFTATSVTGGDNATSCSYF